jgi:hypothetical protein
MKKILFLLIVLLAGLGLGGGAAFATMLALGPRHEAESRRRQGRCRGREGQLRADRQESWRRSSSPTATSPAMSSSISSSKWPQDKSDFVTARLPLLLHAINMRTYRTPMAAGARRAASRSRRVPQGRASGRPGSVRRAVVRKVAVTAATPA